MSILSGVFLFFSVLMTPFIVVESFLLLRAVRNTDSPIPAARPGRRVLIAIVTNGGASSIVNRIIETIRGYGLAVEFAVVREEADGNGYSAPVVVVPTEYRTPRHSLYKARALHYFSEWLRREGYGEETYVIHLDDDSVVSREYARHVFGMEEDAGQGSLRLREYGKSLFSTLADYGRVADCDMYCAYANQRGRPLGVHGEGLVIRADVEEKIGWDFVPDGLCVEDYLMGQSIVASGHTFGYIPGGIFIAPPTNVTDFYRQRRRWLYGFWRSKREAYALNRRASALFLYWYVMGWTVGVGSFVWLYALIDRVPVPPVLLVIFTIGLALSFLEMQYGVYRTHAGAKWHVAMPLLQIPVMVFQSGVLFYTVLRRPRTYDVIAKV